MNLYNQCRLILALLLFSASVNALSPYEIGRECAQIWCEAVRMIADKNFANASSLELRSMKLCNEAFSITSKEFLRGLAGKLNSVKLSELVKGFHESDAAKIQLTYDRVLSLTKKIAGMNGPKFKHYCKKHACDLFLTLSTLESSLAALLFKKDANNKLVYFDL